MRARAPGARGTPPKMKKKHDLGVGQNGRPRKHTQKRHTRFGAKKRRRSRATSEGWGVELKGLGKKKGEAVGGGGALRPPAERRKEKKQNNDPCLFLSLCLGLFSLELAL